MGFYTVLSLNRVDVNVRDIFASPPPTPACPPPLLKVPNPTFMVVSWYCGANGFNKKHTRNNTHTIPQKRTNINFHNTHFYSALRYSQLDASYLVQFLGTCRHIFDIAGGTVHILVIKIQRRYISKHPET